VEEHPHRRIFPNKRARLDADALALLKVAHVGIARGVQKQQPGDLVRGEPVHELAERVVPLGVVAAFRGEPHA